MKKIRLEFMVVPEHLASRAVVPHPICLQITKPNAPYLRKFLGQSGLKLARAGVWFYFTRSLAQKLIAKGIAVDIKTLIQSSDAEDRLGKLD